MYCNITQAIKLLILYMEPINFDRDVQDLAIIRGDAWFAGLLDKNLVEVEERTIALRSPHFKSEAYITQDLRRSGVEC